MRIRTVKPQYLRHELLQDLEQNHPESKIMLVFQGLWMAADSNGVFPWKPRTLKLDILPFIDFNMGKTLELLADNGFIQKYEVEKEIYGQVIKFGEHQRLNGKEVTEGAYHPLPNREVIEKQSGSNGEALEKQSGSNGEAPSFPGKGKEKEKEKERIYASDSEKNQELPENRHNYNRLEIDQLIEHWNKSGLPRFRKMALNISGNELSEMRDGMSWFQPAEILEAISNYGKICADRAAYKPFPEYVKGFTSFCAKGISQWLTASKPFDRCRLSGSVAPVMETVNTGMEIATAQHKDAMEKNRLEAVDNDVGLAMCQAIKSNLAKLNAENSRQGAHYGDG